MTVSRHIRIEYAVDAEAEGLTFVAWCRLMQEVEGWEFVVRKGLCSQAKAERMATKRAAVILHRLAGKRAA